MVDLLSSNQETGAKVQVYGIKANDGEKVILSAERNSPPYKLFELNSFFFFFLNIFSLKKDLPKNYMLQESLMKNC